MLWYKAWLETRWRFAIGFVLAVCSAVSVVLIYPSILKLVPMGSSIDSSGELGRRVRETAELSREFRGYVWVQWCRQNLSQAATLFAVLLGSGSLLAPGGAALFTLSLPVSRGRVALVRAATGLAELFAIVFASTLLVPLVSPAIGEHYGVGSALVHAVCAFVASGLFFSLAFLISSEFSDIWRPLLVTLAVAFVANLAEQILRLSARYGIFGVMSGETYFRAGTVPWIALSLMAAASAAMLYGAARNLAHRDF
jgi:ABC-2 type transport system permease protein